MDEIFNLIESVSEGFPSYSFLQFLRGTEKLQITMMVKCLNYYVLFYFICVKIYCFLFFNNIYIIQHKTITGIGAKAIHFGLS